MKLTFFEKKVRQKTLVGCAANSGAGGARIQAAPRTAGRVLRKNRLRREQRHGSGAETGHAANGENKNRVPHKRDAVRLTVRLYGWNNPFSTNSPDSLNSSSITRERV